MPHGGEDALVWFAESATPAIEFRRMTCQRTKGPGNVVSLQKAFSYGVPLRELSMMLMPLLRTMTLPVATYPQA